MPYNFDNSNWNENSIELKLYSHSEWREKDVVELCTDTGIRIGYLMSASCVETDDEEILDKQNISNYVSRGLIDYYKIPYEDIRYSSLIDPQKDTTCILFVHKPTFIESALEQVDLEAVLVKYGFTTFDKISSESFFTADSLSTLQNEISNGKISVKKIDCTIPVNKTIFNTYLDSLHSLGSPLIQFLMLYQYFEMSMGDIYMPRAEQAFLKLQAGQISKNDFRTVISNLSKEIGLLTEVLSGISTSRFNFIDPLKIEAKVISPYPSNTCDLIYSIRNAIVHRTISFYNDIELVKNINSALLWTIYDIAAK